MYVRTYVFECMYACMCEFLCMYICIFFIDINSMAHYILFLEAEPNVYWETLWLGITTRNVTSMDMFTYPVIGIPVLQIVRESFMHYCHVQQFSF
jgi:hypothetical protein